MTHTALRNLLCEHLVTMFLVKEAVSPFNQRSQNSLSGYISTSTQWPVCGTACHPWPAQCLMAGCHFCEGVQFTAQPELFFIVAALSALHLWTLSGVMDSYFQALQFQCINSQSDNGERYGICTSSDAQCQSYQTLRQSCPNISTCNIFNETIDVPTICKLFLPVSCNISLYVFPHPSFLFFSFLC